MNKKRKESLADLSQTSTYTIRGKQFVVEPVFKDDGRQTLGDVFLRLMVSGEAPVKA